MEVTEIRKAEDIARGLQKQKGDPWQYVICYSTVSTVGFWLFPKTLPQLLAMVDRDLNSRELSEGAARKMKSRLPIMKIGDVAQYRGYIAIIRVPEWGNDQLVDESLYRKEDG